MHDLEENLVKLRRIMVKAIGVGQGLMFKLLKLVSPLAYKVSDSTFC